MPRNELEELYELHVRATNWMVEHREHVDRLVKSAEYCYAPSGSDRLRPELWKEAHWKWYVTNRNEIKSATITVAYGGGFYGRYR